MNASWISCAASAPNPVHRPRILCIGDDPTLLASRKLVLCQAGYDTSSCTSRNASASLVAAQDLVLICRSVPQSVAAEIAADFRRTTPMTSVIRLRPFNIDEAGQYDAMIDSSCGPVPLVLQIAAFLRRKDSSAGESALA